MTFVPNWRAVLRHAWSIRLLILACLLTGIEAAFPLFERLTDRPLWLWVIAIASPIVVAAALFARLMAQRSLTKPSGDNTP